MHQRFRVLFLMLVGLFIVSCNGTTDKYILVPAPSPADNESVKITKVTSKGTEKDKYYDTYIYLADYDFVSATKRPVTLTLCLNQEPEGAFIDKKVLTQDEYTSIGYKKNNCSSADITVAPNEQNTPVFFNLLENVMDISSKQSIFGKAKVYTFVNDDVSAVYYLGDLDIDTIPPIIATEDIIYNDVETDKDWKILAGQKPDFIYVPMTAELMLSGSGANNIKVSSINADKVEVKALQIKDYNGKELPAVNYTLENVVFDPTRIQTDLVDSDNVTINNVDISVIATTDEDNLPYIGMTFKLKIPYADVEKYIPSLGAKNTIINPSLAPVGATLPLVFTATITAKDGTVLTTTSEPFTVDIVDFLYDLSDMWRSLYNAEMLNGIDPMSRPAKKANYAVKAAEGEVPMPNPEDFKEIKYEAIYNQSRGDSHTVYGEVKFLAGLYVEQNSETKDYSMRSQATGNSKVTVIGMDFSIFDALMVATGTPASDSSKSAVAFKYELKIFGKTVLADDISAGGKLKFTKNFSFEKEFSKGDTLVIVVPFNYEVGGRGAIGIVPTLAVEIKQQSYEVPNIIRKLVDNPAPEIPVQPADALTPVAVIDQNKEIPWHLRYNYQYHFMQQVRDARKADSYEVAKLPESAKTFLKEKGLENSITGMESYAQMGVHLSVLTIPAATALKNEWTKRQTNNRLAEARPKKVYEVENLPGTQKDGIGMELAVKARPYIEMSGYIRGGVGVTKTWPRLVFSAGFGFRASVEPLIAAEVVPEIVSFVGISPKDPAVATDFNRLFLKLNYKSPFSYTLIKGKLWAGAHLTAKVKAFVWFSIIDKEWGKTIVENTAIQNTFDVIKPFDKTWVYKLPDNTPPAPALVTY